VSHTVVTNVLYIPFPDSELTIVQRIFLLQLAVGNVPDNSRLVHTAAQQVLIRRVPLHGKEGAGVAAQAVFQLAWIESSQNLGKKNGA